MRLIVWALVTTITLGSGGVAVSREEEPETSKSSDELLVSAASLVKRLGKSPLRVLDTRSEKDYREGRVPGALRVDIREWTARLADPSRRADAKFWGERLGKLGIDPRSRIVVYGSSPVAAARLWWTLRYLGSSDVAILDGGWRLSVEGKHPVSRRDEKVTPTKHAPRFREDVLAVTSDVKKCVGDEKFQLLDTRSVGEWNRGRIPGARRLEWKDLMAEDGRYKPVETMRKIFRDHGLDPRKTIVPY